jgi:lipoprotein-releasing system ATP-binding protein
MVETGIAAAGAESQERLAAAGAEPPALALREIVRTYRQGGAALEVLRGVSLEVRAGEIVALVGPSGAVKSTLLHIAGLLERPDSGEVLVRNFPCGKLGDDERTRLRRAYFGFVYQFHHLLPEFTALENVMLPQMLAGLARGAARDKGRELLHMMGLLERADHRPGRLSGGEQQRVAIARAVANAPYVFIADEPTGNLDHNTADAVFAQLLALVRGAGLAALVATHNLQLASRMDRVLELADGTLVQTKG